MKLKSPEKFTKSVQIVAALVVILGIGAYLFFTERQTSNAPKTPLVAVAATCNDSEANLGVNAIYTKGTVTATNSLGETQMFTDDCANGTILIKFICYESPVGSGHYTDGRTLVSCPHGCANGTCKK